MNWQKGVETIMKKKWGWVGRQMNHYQQKEKQRKDLWGQKTNA